MILRSDVLFDRYSDCSQCAIVNERVLSSSSCSEIYFPRKIRLRESYAPWRCPALPTHHPERPKYSQRPPKTGIEQRPGRRQSREQGRHPLTHSLVRTGRRTHQQCTNRFSIFFRASSISPCIRLECWGGEARGWARGNSRQPKIHRISILFAGQQNRLGHACQARRYVLLPSSLSSVSYSIPFPLRLLPSSSVSLCSFIEFREGRSRVTDRSDIIDRWLNNRGVHGGSY